MRRWPDHLFVVPGPRPGIPRLGKSCRKDPDDVRRRRKKEDTMTEIRVPTLGESVSEATIGRWFKKPGDTVAVDKPLVELATDKATLEVPAPGAVDDLPAEMETDKVTIGVPAPAAGVLSDVAAKDGYTVGVGALLCQIT